MKQYSLIASLLAVSLLAGCQALPGNAGENPDTASSCQREVPNLARNGCLLESWIDFNLAAQRGEPEWRENMLERLDGDSTRHRLARAVVLSWSDDSEWQQASEIYKADLASAPSRLQPLLRQWLNSLEARRALAEELASSEASRVALANERNSLAEKLDALTAIEQSINSRQQEP
ncbi:hypothetical protein SAMN05661010_01520 [Modicisalibacter muralis]|uniref:YfhG lipoprotein n=1 Tax=Modicisalibacter muralis TaxID=119000 RepID=A0A1G9JLN7_9GAMM|nr:hypothetical protein [Halomonas muralis]SDL38361.1 hypothetical protein SAMN05661010_01520 [Halomonas muralis]